LEIDVIWNAVEVLAESLEWPWEADEGGVGVFTETMAGPTARAIMRRLGLRPGMLDPLCSMSEDRRAHLPLAEFYTSTACLSSRPRQVESDR
jgi:hypothetical protein